MIQNWTPNPTCRKTPTGGSRIARIMRRTSILAPFWINVSALPIDTAELQVMQASKVHGGGASVRNGDALLDHLEEVEIIHFELFQLLQGISMSTGNPGVDFLFSLILLFSIPLLDLSHQLVPIALDYIKVISSKLAPLALSLAAHLFPFSFQDFDVHAYLPLVRGLGATRQNTLLL